MYRTSEGNDAMFNFLRKDLKTLEVFCTMESKFGKVSHVLLIQVQFREVTELCFKT